MIFDVDGVLTDGTLWYGPAGEALKAFSAHDGHGIKLLAAAGVAVALLSGRRSKAVAVRARELGIRRVFQGVDDKLSVFEKLLKKERLKPESAGFMGDELVDLPVLERCGFACAPREAPEAVRSRVHYVTEAPAGRGAVRELCDLMVRTA
jgi:3-deoxy-D-manno-octulosonate 8-phosphate phosphatase (KDO 8-P phosphatase)